MTTLGLDASLIAPNLEMSRIEPRMEMLGEAGVRHLAVALSRPRLFDAAGARAFAQRWNVELSFSLPRLEGIDLLASPQDGLDVLEPALRIAAEASGAGLLSLSAPLAPFPVPRAPTLGEIDAFSRFGERAARLARAQGVRLCLEPASRRETHLLNTAAQAAWLVERVGAESLGIGLDTAAVLGEERSFASAFEAAAPFLLTVALSESDRGVFGRGLLDWQAAFAGLAGIGYSGPLVARAQPPAGAAEAPAPWRARGFRLEDLVEEGLPFLREKAGAVGLVF